MEKDAGEQLILLGRTLQQLGKLSDTELDAFLAVWEPCTAHRKEILTAAGEQERYLYFVTQGIQRIFYSDEQGREATILFTYAPSFGGVLDAFFLQNKSKYNYETLSPSVFLRTNYNSINQLILSYPAIELLIRNGIANALGGVLERIVEQQCFSSEEKFKQLLQRSPHILQLVPHKYLASYLGIDATNFSKLINRVKI